MQEEQILTILEQIQKDIEVIQKSVNSGENGLQNNNSEINGKIDGLDESISTAIKKIPVQIALTIARLFEKIFSKYQESNYELYAQERKILLEFFFKEIQELKSIQSKFHSKIPFFGYVRKLCSLLKRGTTTIIISIFLVLFVILFILSTIEKSLLETEAEKYTIIYSLSQSKEHKDQKAGKLINYVDSVYVRNKRQLKKQVQHIDDSLNIVNYIKENYENLEKEFNKKTN